MKASTSAARQRRLRGETRRPRGKRPEETIRSTVRRQRPRRLVTSFMLRRLLVEDMRRNLGEGETGGRRDQLDVISKAGSRWPAWASRAAGVVRGCRSTNQIYTKWRERFKPFFLLQTCYIPGIIIGRTVYRVRACK